MYLSISGALAAQSDNIVFTMASFIVNRNTIF